jgi:predicted nucleotidyltransferase
LNESESAPPELLAVARDLATALFVQDDVVAIWLGGSMARGNSDKYSDIDLRVAVAPIDFARWKNPDLKAVLRREVVGYKPQNWGEDGVLHHLLLKSGQIVDLFVMTTARENPEDAIAVLKCRDPEFAKTLERFRQAAPAGNAYEAAEGAVLRQVLIEFWINTHKHRKVLHREIDLLVITGLGFDRAMLSRLWYAELTGMDFANRRPSIFQMSATSKALREGVANSMEVLGMGTSDRNSLCRAIERIRDEVASVGRRLASRFDFDYPEDVEKIVRSGWQEFLERQRS